MRGAAKRTRKYEAKTDGDVAKLRVDEYGKRQKTSFKTAVQEQTNIEQVVKSIIKTAPSMLTHFYCDFAKKAVQLSKKFKGAVLVQELDILDNIWESRGLDTTLLNNIKAYFTPGYVPPAPPVITYFRLNISLLDGPDVLE